GIPVALRATANRGARWENHADASNEQFDRLSRRTRSSVMLIEQALARRSPRHRPDWRSVPERTSSAPTPRARTRIRLFVLDEEGLMRDGLCTLLASPPDFEIAGKAPITPEGVRAAAHAAPNVVILDFPSATLQGTRLISSLKAQLPKAGIIVLTFRKEEHL